MRPMRLLFAPTKSYHDLPEKLYRFRGFSRKRHIKEELEAAKIGKVRFTDPSNFNDPYDCKTAMYPCAKGAPVPIIQNYYERGYASKKDLVRLDDLKRRVARGEEIEAVSIFMQQTAESLTSRVACACFVEEWQNMAMWNHYANGHTGVCLEFTRDERLGDLYTTGLRLAEERVKLQKVKYISKPVLYQMEDLLELYFSGSRELIHTEKISFYEFIENTFFSKSVHWESEKEWRALVNYQQDLSKDNWYSAFPGYNLTGVFIGPRASDEHVETIRKLCDKNGVSAYRSVMLRTDYALSLHPAKMTVSEVFKAGIGQGL